MTIVRNCIVRKNCIEYKVCFCCFCMLLLGAKTVLSICRAETLNCGSNFTNCQDYVGVIRISKNDPPPHTLNTIRVSSLLKPMEIHPIHSSSPGLPSPHPHPTKIQITGLINQFLLARRCYCRTIDLCSVIGSTPT